MMPFDIDRRILQVLGEPVIGRQHQQLLDRRIARTGLDQQSRAVVIESDRGGQVQADEAGTTPRGNGGHTNNKILAVGTLEQFSEQTLE